MFSAIFLFLCTTCCCASILRVPADYSTIQAALNATAVNDTVLVALGTYAEALIVPPRSIFLKGDVTPDTGDYPRPIIDPSTLSNPTGRTCLATGGGILVVEDFVFRNGPAMYPRSGFTTGGIANNSPNFTVRRCIFDSTYIGILSTNLPIIAQDCRFYDNQVRCVNCNVSALHAENCYFSGQSNWAVITANAHSSFINCSFRDNHSEGNMLLVGGTDITIRNCIFGPFDSHFSAPLAGNFWNSIVEQNLFTNCTIGPAIIQFNCVCDSPTVFRNNYFLHNRNPGSRFGYGQGGTCISGGCGDNSVCNGIIIENNIFEECSSYVQAKALTLFASANVHHNRFVNMQPDTLFTALGLRDSILFRDNYFDRNGSSIASQDFTLDALFNWWGDPTGPYHPTLNPLGQGDRVGDNVNFTPWYTDTSFFNLSTDEPRTLHPTSFSLSVYPNPFNSTAKIKLQVKEPMIVKVELFDLLGRRVKELYNAPVAYEKEISFQADNLSSGVYFVRAKDTIWNRPLATQKMLLLK